MANALTKDPSRVVESTRPVPTRNLAILRDGSKRGKVTRPRLMIPMIPLFHLQGTESDHIYPLSALDNHVVSFAYSRQKVRSPNALKYMWTPSHISLFSGIIYNEVSRTHSVVGINDEFLAVQRTCGVGLANDLQNSHKKSRRMMSIALNQTPQGVVLTWLMGHCELLGSSVYDVGE